MPTIVILGGGTNHAVLGSPYVGFATSDTITICLLYTSDAADERSSVDLGGRRIIKKKKREKQLYETVK